jgi:hypothetical protein
VNSEALEPGRWRLIHLILQALSIAISVRLFRRRIETVCPAVLGRYNISEENYAKLAEDVDKLVKWLIFWRRQRCFYRSFCLMYILRHCDLPLNLNFGIQAANEHGRSRIHCWLTLEDKLFLEEPGTAKDFPVFVGRISDGRISYWSGR